MYDPGIEALADREIAAFLEEEYARQGEQLYQWYRLKFLAANNKQLTSSIGLAHYDRAIVRFVLEHCRFASRFVEVGAGVAQECMLLALNGLPAFGVETDQMHLDMMRRLRDRLAERLDRRLPMRMTPIRDFYPTRAVEYLDSTTVLAFPTLSWGITSEQERQIIESMRLAGGVIFSLEGFFRNRSTAEKEALVESIRMRGFGEPVEVFSWPQWEMGFAANRIMFMKRL
jgi:hypothetical protein